MKKIIWVIFFFFAGLITQAQCDVELKKAEAEKNDTLQLRLFRRLMDCYYKAEDFDGANNLLIKNKKAADKLIFKTKDSIFYSNYLSDLSTYYYYKGDIQNCSKISEQVLQYDYRKSDSNKIAGSLGNLAITYRMMGNYPKAIYCNQEAIKINQKIKRNAELTKNYSNLSNVYLDIEEFAKGKFYLEQAIKIREKEKDLKGLFTSYGNMGNYFQKTNQFDSAIKFYYKAVSLIPTLKLKKSKTGIVYNNLTALYLRKNNLDSAKYYSNIAEDLLTEKMTPHFFTVFYLNKGDIEGKSKNFKQAIKDFDAGIKTAAENNDLDNLKDLNFYKSKFFYLSNQTDSAFQCLTRAHKYRDSIMSSSKTAEITRYEMQYQFDKEQDVLKNSQLKKEIEAKNEIERKQILIYAAIFVMVLLVGLVLIILKSNYQKKKDNVLLQQKNDLIETQKKDIIDSINYAKNLQQAILPPISKIRQELGDVFVYYKPKDIIAGDFYWLYKTQDKKDNNDVFLFAVADCTGHGVPGALVSVVCSNALDSAVKEYGLIDPGKILDKTKEIVIDTFSKTGQNVKDGMDISLCSIQRQTLSQHNSISINWAGANSSLWYIQKNEIKEISGNKQPIGFSENKQPFTTHDLNLKEGDTLYFSTDGFYDQFGGNKANPSGKKFMRKRLSQLFFSIKDQSIETQYKTVDDAFCNWKGDLEQIDDVCVAGIKL